MTGTGALVIYRMPALVAHIVFDVVRVDDSERGSSKRNCFRLFMTTSFFLVIRYQLRDYLYKSRKIKANQGMHDTVHFVSSASATSSWFAQHSFKIHIFTPAGAEKLWASGRRIVQHVDQPLEGSFKTDVAALSVSDPSDPCMSQLCGRHRRVQAAGALGCRSFSSDQICFAWRVT